MGESLNACKKQCQKKRKMDKKSYFFDYFFLKSNWPKYLNLVISRMERFHFTTICRREDLNIILAELREELEYCKSKNPKSEAAVDLYVNQFEDGGQFVLRPKQMTEDCICRLDFKLVREFITYDSNLNSWRERTLTAKVK